MLCHAVLDKDDNRNTRTRCEIFSKLTINTPERLHWRQIFFYYFYKVHLVLFQQASITQTVLNKYTNIHIFKVSNQILNHLQSKKIYIQEPVYTVSDKIFIFSTFHNFRSSYLQMLHRTNFPNTFTCFPGKCL